MLKGTLNKSLKCHEYVYYKYSCTFCIMSFCVMLRSKQMGKKKIAQFFYFFYIQVVIFVVVYWMWSMNHLHLDSSVYHVCPMSANFFFQQVRCSICSPTDPLPPSVVEAETLSHQSILVTWDKPAPVQGYISHYTVHWIQARGQDQGWD